MSLTLYQIASRVGPGNIMQQLQSQRLQALQGSSAPRTSFAEQLQRAERGQQQLDRMPVTTETQAYDASEPKPVVIDMEPPRAEAATLAARRAMYRENYKIGFRVMRHRYPELGQSQMGWVMAGLSRALSDDPSMARKDLKDLVHSLVHNAPEYEEEVA